MNSRSGPEDPTKRVESARLALSSTPTIPDHELVRCIGRGSYGEVWLARNVMGTYRAVKIVYRKNFEHDRPYGREFNGIKKFEPISRTHEGLVDILQVGRNEEAKYFYYVMELADDLISGQQIDAGSYEQKTLADSVTDEKPLPVDECLQLGLSIASAVGHLHKHGLIHRDIKPSNIIFVNGVPKLADIGLVTDVGTPSIPGGTLGYIAPEGIPSAQSDIYSLGKVLYEISTGKDRQEYPELPEHWGDGTDSEKRYEINEIIIKACQTDRSSRYQTAAELSADLVLVQAGKSVKRLRVLERRLAFLTRVGIGVAALGLIIAGAYYQAHREEKIKTRQLGSFYATAGVRAEEKLDLVASLPWFAEALLLDTGHSQRENRDRVQIGTVLRQCPSLLQMWLQEHPVNDVEFTPDGRQVIAASDDGIVRFWDTASGHSLSTLAAHSNQVLTVAVSADGRHLVTASKDNTACVWNAQTHERLQLLPHPDEVRSARWNRRGDQIVTACADTIVRVWHPVSGELLHSFSNHNDAVEYASFSPDGNRIISAGRDGGSFVWDWKNGKVKLHLKHPRLKGSFNWLYSAEFSPDGRFIVTASFDYTARVWDAQTGQQLHVLRHAQAVRNAEFSPDGRYVVTASGDFTTRFWEAMTGQETLPPLKHSAHVNRAHFSPEGKRVVTATAMGVVCVWDIGRVSEQLPLEPIFYSPQGNRYAALRTNSVQIHDAATGQSVGPGLLTERPVRDLRFSADGTHVLTIFTRAQLRGEPVPEAQLWDTGTGKPLGPCFAFTNYLADLSDDGQRLVTMDETLAYVWNTAKGELVGSALEHPHKVNKEKVSFDHSGTRLLTISGTTVHVWNLAQSRRMFTLQHPCEVSHAEFSPDDRMLATACRDDQTMARAAQVWDAFTGQPIGPPLKHSDGVSHVAFGPDSQRVVTAGEDRTAIIWNFRDGTRIQRLVHQRGLAEVTFSLDGRRVATVCNDDTARVWEVDTGLPITPPLKHHWTLWHAQFIANGQRLFTKRLKGELWMLWEKGKDPHPWPWMAWDLSPDNRPVQDLVRISQLLSGHQIDASGEMLPLPKPTLSKLWQELRTRYPAEFESPAGETLAWHQREAQSSEGTKDWFSAVFHLNQLMILQPDNELFRARLSSAQSKLDGSNKPAAQPATAGNVPNH